MIEKTLRNIVAKLQCNEHERVALEELMKKIRKVASKKTKKQTIEEIQNLKNPYPKDIFRWDNEEKIEIRNDKNLIDCVITRGKFNHFIFQVVENTKEDIIKLIKGLEKDD